MGAAAEEAATAASGSREMMEADRPNSLGEQGGVEDKEKLASHQPSEMSEPQELEELPSQPVWPPTRTNTPDHTADSAAEPEKGSGPDEFEPARGTDAAESVPRSATATLSRREPESTATGVERGAEPTATGAERGTEPIPADIGQKLDEIASLLRTLLLQNMASRAADGDGSGGGGAARLLGGMTEEQLRALLRPLVADRAATGDSPPHKPR